jgi:flavin reductase (DIM6/NTAB) family NADH-FMN oxidoreductase RutF
MTKISVPPQELRMYYTYAAPLPTILVTAIDENARPNIITVAWHSPISIAPTLYGISIGPKRHSHGLIAKAGEFVINFPAFGLLDKVHHCGSVSGRTADKFRQTGLTPLPSDKIKTPGIAECYLNLECKVAEGAVFGDHTWFVGEVLNIRADEGLFEEGILKEQGDPILYMGKDLYCGMKGQRVQMRQRK